jgi:hypothetical protein
VAGLSVAGIYTDPATGTITFTQGANYVSSRIRSCGNGIYRVELTFTAAASGATTIRQQILNAAGATIYAGDGTSGVYVWGAQLEVGAFASPYMPTTAATVTRNAPTLTMPTGAFDFNSQEGTLMVAYTKGATVPIGCLAALQKSGAGTDFVVLRDGSSLGGSPGSSDLVVATSAGGVVVDTSGPATADGALHTAVGSYKLNDFAYTGDGQSVSSDSSGNLPVGIDQLTIGVYGATLASDRFSGWFSKLAFYPKRLSNNEHVALSTL